MAINSLHRRELLKLAGMGGVVFASRLAGLGAAGALLGTAAADADPAPAAAEDFFFIQLSDTHWGYEGPANPQSHATLPKVIETINGLALKPDFIVLTGDLTHNTDDPYERRRRLLEYRQLISGLQVKELRFLPGEHDAALDYGTVYRSIFGPSWYSFDHKGVHFIALDNVSDPRGLLGEAQLDWLKKDLATLGPAAHIVVFSHRPLFSLYPYWEWDTRDGDAAIGQLMPFANVTAFYGHIHQELHTMTGHIAHHAATSLMFPLPPAGSKPKPAPVPWNPQHPFQGLGYRSIAAQAASAEYQLTQLPVVKGG
jgi:3',5'-cyclic AMP phosphodiesterase CpdA